jgi:carboxypeptidase Q
MGNRTCRRLVAPLILFAAAAQGFGQADPATTQRIIDQGKNHSQVVQLLRELTNIGPRLTSSTNLERAQAWAMGKLKSWGLQNVHLEKWGEFPVGFDRGKCTGRMVSPTVRDFEFTSPSWSEGTHGNKKGLAINAPTTMDEFNDMKGKLKGAWVLYKVPPPRPPRVRPGETPPEPTPEQKAALELQKAINDAGILGTVMAARSGGNRPDQGELTVTSGQWRDKTIDNHPMDVSITIRKSDMDEIQKNLDASKPVTLEFNLDHKWRKGPISISNVVADLPGTEKPDEVVIVSGHQDSWDGPGSQGALDNGVGSCTALEAARILMAAHAKPKRTIRFILWSGEEEGLFGSAGYVRDHKAEMDKISAVLVDDGGTNYQGGYQGLASQKDIFEAAFAPVVAAFPDMPEKFVVGDRMPRGGGSDHASFNAVGVPGFFTIETGTSDYTFVHHTQHDRFELAIPPYLVQSGTNHAAVSYYLACLPGLLPRQPVTPPPPAK